MQRVTPYTTLLPNEMKQNNKIFEEIQYESVLFTYFQDMSNAFIRIAHTIDPSQKFKYMVAVRPYTVSVDFLSSVYDSFNEISKDRIIINFVVGNVNDIPENILNENSLVDTYEKRLIYHKSFISRFKDKYIGHIEPTVYVSGSSDYLINTGLNYSDGIITEFANYNKFKHILDKNVVFLLPICIRDDVKEAELLGKQSGREGVYGNIDTMKERFEYIESLGVKQLMLCPLDNDDSQYKIHENMSKFVK
jgi:hypothetical protein